MSTSGHRHRKRVKHFHEPGDLHELTFSTYRRKPLLTNDRWRRWLSQSIDKARQKQSCRLVAFVYMPEHVHLLILPENPDRKTISRYLSTTKRPVSVNVKQALTESGSALLKQLTVLERPGKTVFRFWQEGPGYDRNMNDERTVLTAIDYIHENPVRRGLCRSAVDWKWSSARWYASEGTIVDPDLPTIDGLPPGFFVRDSRSRLKGSE